ncbi:hypothetical protein WJX72_008811 [[Myrmecia] bisecta]|uniref:ATP-grasp domain-containing protein n=1 Tax=[Myrmecia] bisecta TaxID=41462 RepID=A0AAW1QFS1_9CHLO
MEALGRGKPTRIELCSHLVAGLLGADCMAKLTSRSNGHHTSDTGKVKLPPEVPQSLVDLTPSATDQDVLEALVRNKHAQDAALAELAQCSLAQRIQARIKAAVLLAVMLCTLPWSLAGAMLLCTLQRLRAMLPSSRTVGEHNNRKASMKTAIVTSGHMTKALHAVRHLHRAGWRVVVVDYDKWWMAMTRFSNCADVFEAVPDPGWDPEGYMRGIARIARQYSASLIVPVAPPNHSIYDSLVKDILPAGCRSVALGAPITALLDDKVKYSELCEKVGVRTPRHFRVSSAQQLLDLNSRRDVFAGAQFLLKSIAYDPSHRVDLFKLPCSETKLQAYLRTIEISEACPWMLQQFLTGQEFSCYTIAHEGQVKAHADNEASISCLSYEHVGSEDIWRWVERFCAGTRLNGQVCFDFMRNEQDGQMYSIECNPRNSTVITTFHDQPLFAAALTDPQAVTTVVKPVPGSPPLYWFWNEAYTLVSGKGSFWVWAHTMWRGVDAVFEAADPLPFFAMHYLQAPVQLARNVVAGRPWVKLDLCIGKVSELGGD